MTKTKTKRNTRESHTSRAFKICRRPIVHLPSREAAPQVLDRTTMMRAHGQPFLFAIARDPHTIFVSWQIDWRSIFGKAIPTDRQVRIRLIGRDKVTEATAVVEPGSDMHYLTTSGLHAPYRVEIGYLQSFDAWRSVASSDEVEMPLGRGGIDISDAQFATVPFHLKFQKLAKLLGADADAPIATAMSEFQKRVLADRRPNEKRRLDKEVLRGLNLSLDQIAAGERSFKSVDTHRLTRRAQAMSGSSASSPFLGLHANPSS
jgi:hypothetical protein